MIITAILIILAIILTALAIGVVCFTSPTVFFTVPTIAAVALSYGLFGPLFGTLLAIPIIVIWAYLVTRFHQEWKQERMRRKAEAHNH